MFFFKNKTFTYDFYYIFFQSGQLALHLAGLERRAVRNARRRDNNANIDTDGTISNDELVDEALSNAAQWRVALRLTLNEERSLWPHLSLEHRVNR